MREAVKEIIILSSLLSPLIDVCFTGELQLFREVVDLYRHGDDSHDYHMILKGSHMTY